MHHHGQLSCHSNCWEDALCIAAMENVYDAGTVMEHVYDEKIMENVYDEESMEHVCDRGTMEHVNAEETLEHVYDEETRLRLSDDFPHSCGYTYLDHAGTTLYSKTQMESVMRNLQSNLFVNPHTSEAAGVVEEARRKVLDFFNADPDEYSVVFTSGATAALKMVGECFPFHSNSAFVLHAQSHTSAVGVREYAIEKGANYVLFDCFEHVFSDVSKDVTSNSLYCFPAMSNYSGEKFDLSNIHKIKQLNPKNYVLLDAASFAATNKLNLDKLKPDFVPISFYKMFGYPTGLGALLVKNSSANILRKRYFGGGTVEMNQTITAFHVSRSSVESKFEDGTINFLGIASLQYGFNQIDSIPGGIESISQHTFNLARYTHNKLKDLEHGNGNPVVQLYSKTGYTHPSRQGGIVNFNLLDSKQDPIGYSNFQQVAALHSLVVRTGCFCNTGGCQEHLGISDDQLRKNHALGHVCGDNVDMVAGKLTGSIRASFGYMSTREDADKLIGVIKEYFVEKEDEAAANNVVVESEGLRIVGLYVYPIKSCGGIAVNSSWPMTEAGLKYDRQWMVMRGGKVLTQKKEPLLAQIQPSIDLHGMKMRLSFPGMELVEVDLHSTDGEDEEREVCIGNVCGEEVEGVSCGRNLSNWLEEALGISQLKLIRGTRRRSKRRQVTNSLANDSEILLLNLASVQFLAEKVKEGCEKRNEAWQEFSVENLTKRFRGNIVVEGEEPFQEELWNGFEVGGVKFGVGGPCKRCQMITVEQSTGQVTKEPLRSLALIKNRNFNFGIHTLIKTIHENAVLRINEPLLRF